MTPPNPFRLSAAQRIAQCPGSVKACAPLRGKDTSSPEAERGKRIHLALAKHYVPEQETEETPTEYDNVLP